MAGHQQHLSWNDVVQQRKDFYLKPSTTVRGAIGFCLLMGLITFGSGIFLGQATRAWGSLLFNVFFFFSLALGGSVFAAIQDLIGAKWGRPIIRIHEAYTSFLPVAALLFFVFFAAIALRFAGAGDVYSWIKDHDLLHHYWGKRTWLQEWPMLIRDSIALVIILALCFWQIGKKLSRDKEALSTGESASAISKQRSLRYWSAPVLIVYALCFSLLSFDLLKSLAPTWISTLWAGWTFAIMMQTLMALNLIFMFALKETAVGRLIGRQQFHDVGKLMHGFTVFFAYLTYAHVLTYWYGNMPEETQYFIHRLQAPWKYIVYGAPVFSFVVPLFVLLPKMSKWTKQIALPISVIILFAQWLSMLLVVQPQVVEADAWKFPWLELGVFLGVLGLFLTCFFRFSQKNPMVAIGDPLLKESLSAHH